jgi:hypothetical protein
MATRKQTPDVLSEILGGAPSAPAPEPAPTPGSAPEPQPAAEPEPAAKPGPTAKPKPPRQRSSRRPRARYPKWEYMEVVFRDYGGYRPRCVNGQEQDGWKRAPLMHEYLNQLGEEGWELAGVGSRRNDQMPAYLKRAKK